MGDDLTAARRFCDTVRSDMTSLMDGVCAQPCAAPDVLVGSLVRIQSGAKQLHARAIFRAAQTVVNAVNDRAPLPAVQGRVLSLNKLITQYECGLEDIAPRPANGEYEIDMPAETLVFSTTEPPMPDVDARFRAARAALAPLMGFAQQGVEREALTRLAGFSETELDIAKIDAAVPDADVDVSLEAIFDDTPDVISESIIVPAQTRTAAAPPALMLPTRQIDFEALMPSFVSHALQEARQTDKTVSVSYAAEGVSLGQNQMTALQTTFDHIAKTLVSSVLERPEIRRARGESGAGHIAVTATQMTDTVTISIECPGTALAVSAYMPASQRTEGLIITPGSNALDGLAHIVLTVPRKTRAAATENALTPNAAEMAS